MYYLTLLSLVGHNVNDRWRSATSTKQVQLIQRFKSSLQRCCHKLVLNPTVLKILQAPTDHCTAMIAGFLTNFSYKALWQYIDIPNSHTTWTNKQLSSKLKHVDQPIMPCTMSSLHWKKQPLPMSKDTWGSFRPMTRLHQWMHWDNATTKL